MPECHGPFVDKAVCAAAACCAWARTAVGAEKTRRHCPAEFKVVVTSTRFRGAFGLAQSCYDSLDLLMRAAKGPPSSSLALSHRTLLAVRASLPQEAFDPASGAAGAEAEAKAGFGLTLQEAIEKLASSKS